MSILMFGAQIMVALSVRIWFVSASPVPDTHGPGDPLSIDITTLITALPAFSTSSNGSLNGSAPIVVTQSTPVKAVVTVLSSIALVLVAATYLVLVTSSGRLLDGFYLPCRAVEAKMEIILRNCWPAHLHALPEAAKEFVPVLDNTWPILLYVVENPSMARLGSLRPGAILYQLEQPENAMNGDRKVCKGAIRPDTKLSIAAGHNELRFISAYHPKINTPAVKVSTSSPAPRHLSHFVVWQWVSLWLVVILLWNTLLYNGIIGGATSTNDRYPRLFIVSIYILLFGVQLVYSFVSVPTVYEHLAEQASWKMIFQAGFFLVAPGRSDLWLLDRVEDGGDVAMENFQIDVLGKVKRGKTLIKPYREASNHEVIAYVEDHGDAANPGTAPKSFYLLTKGIFYPKNRREETANGHMVASGNGAIGDNERESRRDKELMEQPNDASESQASDDQGDPGLEDVEADYDANLKALEKATELALDRVVLNVALLLGICMATGFATWTQTQLPDATSTQIGSYALLASTSTAIGILLTTLFQVGNIKNSAEAVVRLTEMTVYHAWFQKRGWSALPGPAFGFKRPRIDYFPPGLFKPPAAPVRLLRFWWESATYLFSRAQSYGSTFVHITRILTAIFSLLFGPGFALLPSPHPDVGAIPKIQLGGHTFIMEYEPRGGVYRTREPADGEEPAGDFE
ncbi:hypothetical protein QBC47DRAFT_445265 [Echria macrotheca]|uniref:Uncharacterized protein n=1 Tax=Echria macrotheca TaxID=438768 RepID=A0AAJ0F7A5_9PEZI|nr:hypothetical protein QBC47DRAFT_445265 [Echria macrotheca]